MRRPGSGLTGNYLWINRNDQSDLQWDDVGVCPDQVMPRLLNVQGIRHDQSDNTYFDINLPRSLVLGSWKLRWRLCRIMIRSRVTTYPHERHSCVSCSEDTDLETALRPPIRAAFSCSRQSPRYSESPLPGGNVIEFAKKTAPRIGNAICFRHWPDVP